MPPRDPSPWFHILSMSPCHSRVSGLHEANYCQLSGRVLGTYNSCASWTIGLHLWSPLLQADLALSGLLFIIAVANPDSLCLRSCITFFKLKLELIVSFFIDLLTVRPKEISFLLEFVDICGNCFFPNTVLTRLAFSIPAIGSTIVSLFFEDFPSSFLPSPLVRKNFLTCFLGIGLARRALPLR